MKASYKLLLASALLILTTGSSSAAVYAENFENGLADWTATGDVSVQGASGNRSIVLTTAFTGIMDDAVALNLSGVDPVSSAGSLDAFVGVALGALDLDAINQATEGSAFKRTFSVTAGDTLTFDWNLATMETVGRDYGFVTINGTMITLCDVADALKAGTAPYLSQTGSGQFHYVFQSTGDVTVAFGVTDVGDYSTTTAMTIGNVSIVPEPSAALLGALGMLGMLRRRK